ncbi:MAG: glycosyltransferase [Synergistaceae bacterium]|nr:glycosyltransferase [Synergistaceae bacterium]
MRVLLIDKHCGTGGPGKVAAGIAGKFEREGHEARIAYGRSGFVPEKFRKYAVRIGTMKDVYLHAVMTRLTDRTGFYSRKATEDFLRWADEYDPGLLWLHNIHGYYVNIELLFDWIKSRPNMKVNWTLHDCWAFTGHCAYFTMAGCGKWRTHCEHCPQKNTYPASFVDGSYRNYEDKRRLFTGVHDMTIITPSQWLAGLVGQSFLGGYPVEVQKVEISREIFRPRPSGFREKSGLAGKIIVLGVANVWDKRKGLDDFVKLSGMLDRERFAVVLVGVSRKQAKSLPEGIITIQRTESQKELAEIYTAADVFFMPSCEENYPAVCLEAEACGTPVIAYNAGGTPETLHDPRSKLVEIGDIEAVRKIITEM